MQPMIEDRGWELILGSFIDPHFGPVLLFGAGGILVEVLGDRSLALPPLNRELVRRLMERTRIFERCAAGVDRTGEPRSSGDLFGALQPAR